MYIIFRIFCEDSWDINPLGFQVASRYNVDNLKGVNTYAVHGTCAFRMCVKLFKDLLHVILLR